ncbi:MAG TPA: glycogen/starch/alpha-glucan phosphorylase, partial [Gemmataceae bacterium]|nr:glycogen/starch/alpha-glucan phosphorylase [Gemmataceae bacterium]
MPPTNPRATAPSLDAVTPAAKPRSRPSAAGVALQAEPDTTGVPAQYECGPVRFAGDPNASYERRLVFDHVVEPKRATTRERFEAVARALRDLLTQRWLKTDQAYDRANPKRVYYLSMEFLIGRSLTNNITNLMVEPVVQEAMRKEGLDPAELAEQEPDAGLGNGGLGRLAACFLDSMATMQLPAVGYGLRYEYGIFCQEIEHSSQVERPDNWLRRPDPWEIARPEEAVQARLNCSVRIHNGEPYLAPNTPRVLLGVPYDRPVVGYGGRTINTLRLWGAAAPDFFNLGEFNHGDFFGAVLDRVTAENLTRVLYPDDSTDAGRRLRFMQEYFLVACSLADILRRFRKDNTDWRALPDTVAIQLNDTHPSLAVAELMRVLLDDARLGWDEAWDLTVRTLAYTNHTLLPEALEQWP